MIKLHINTFRPVYFLVLLSFLGVQIVSTASASALTPPKGAYWFNVYQIQKAWQYSEGAGVTVAVVDTGVQADLGDLRGQVLPGLDFSGADPGGNKDDPQDAQTPYGHGTDMATLIAGTGAGAGMVGVAPEAKILPVDIGTGGVGNLSTSAAAQGVRAAVDKGAKVINLSFGSVSPCDLGLGAAIKYAYQHDVIVVAAAGDSPGPVSSPANCPGAIAVGGVDANGTPWTKTPTGPEIDLVSSAYNLVSEELNGTFYGPSPDNSGTSTSAALVSGFFALLRAHWPNESARRIVARAVYWAHTGRGEAGIDKRIDNTLGYGEMIPYDALSNDTPANAPNPIYDAFDKKLNLVAAEQPASNTKSANVQSGKTTSHATKTPGWLIAVIALAVIACIAGLITLIARTSARKKQVTQPVPTRPSQAATAVTTPDNPTSPPSTPDERQQ